MKPAPDPHGQAALLLVESLLLLLVERGVVQKEQVVEAIAGLVEVNQEIAGTSESVVVSMVSIGLLRALAGSLSAATAPIGPAVIS
jgi:hypothetical protein